MNKRKERKQLIKWHIEGLFDPEGVAEERYEKGSPEYEEELERLKTRREVVKDYTDAVGLDVDELSLAWYRDSVALMYAAPWVGEHMLTKPVDKPDPSLPEDHFDNRTWGGWTKERVLEAMADRPSAGRLIVLDFDGRKEKTGEDGTVNVEHLKPLVSNVNRVVKKLSERGLRPAVVETTTVDSDDRNRSKVHLTFVAKEGQRATTEQEHEERFDFLLENTREIISGMCLEDDEREALQLDEATRKVCGLKRLAGHDKAGRGNFVDIMGPNNDETADPEARIDWNDVLETRTQVVKDGPAVEYRFGERVEKIAYMVDKDGNITNQIDPSKSYLIAHNVFPLHMTKDRDTGERAVYFRADDERGRTHYETLPLANFVDARKNDELGRLRNFVSIRPNKSKEFITAIDYWSQSKQASTASEHVSTERQGWVEGDDGKPVYINGKTVYGADWIAKGKAAETRSESRGSLAGWKQGVSNYCTTPGSLIAIGQALAGPLLYPVNKSSYLLHFYGPSTTGKTSGLYVGASVWGQPKTGAYVETWRTTDNSLEKRLQDKSGALMALDELKELGSSEKARKDLRKIVMMLANEKGKGRLTSNVEARQSFTWSLTALSTGENSIADWLGDLQQGGESVRALDVPVESGDITTGYDHAIQIKDWASKNWGQAGPAFGAWLVNNLETAVKGFGPREKRLRGLVEASEEERVASNVAAIWLALDLALEAGVLPDSVTPERIENTVKWCLQKVSESRGDTNSPETRALEMLRDLIASEPSKFPRQDKYSESYGYVVGIRQVVRNFGPGAQNDDGATGFTTETGKIYICESTLKDSGIPRKAGVGPRKFLSWLEKHGMNYSPDGQKEIGGVKKRWHLIDLFENEIVIGFYEQNERVHIWYALDPDDAKRELKKWSNEDLERSRHVVISWERYRELSKVADKKDSIPVDLFNEIMNKPGIA